MTSSLVKILCTGQNPCQGMIFRFAFRATKLAKFLSGINRISLSAGIDRAI